MDIYLYLYIYKFATYYIYTPKIYNRKIREYNLKNGYIKNNLKIYKDNQKKKMEIFWVNFFGAGLLPQPNGKKMAQPILIYFFGVVFAYFPSI